MTGHWFAFDAGGHAQAWLHLPEDNDAGLLGVIFPDAPVPGPLARAVAAACRQDAVARLAALLGLACRQVADAVPDAALALTGSGAVDAILPAPLSARLLLGAEPAARWRKGPRKTTQRRGEPLASATAALASRPLSLELELEGCELEVGALQGLQIGDVVRLNHGLQSPASVRHAGHRMCSAYLGRLGDRKAVELATGDGPR